MRSSLYPVELSGRVLIGTLLLPATATTTAQDQMRFRAKDRNRDGVVTRAEWQGSDQYQAGCLEGFGSEVAGIMVRLIQEKPQ